MTSSPESNDDLTLVRARALASAGRMAWFQADFEAARRQLQESLRLFQQVGDLVGTLDATSGLILVLTRQGEVDGALALMNEAKSLLEPVRERREILPVLSGLARAASFTVDEEALRFALEWGEEATHLAQEMGDKRSLAWALNGLAMCHYYGGNMKSARADIEEGLPLFEELGDLWGVSLLKWLLGNVARREGQWDEARQLNRQAITLQSQNNSRQGFPYMLDSFAFLAIEEKQPERAVRLLASAAIRQERSGTIMQPLYRVEHERYVERLRAMISASEWEALWDEGRRLSVEATLALALETADS